MTRRMALADVQERLPRLIEELREAGESVEIEADGRVVARLEPGDAPTGGSWTRDPLFTAFADFDEDLLEKFHRHVMEIHNEPLHEPIRLDP